MPKLATSETRIAAGRPRLGRVPSARRRTQPIAPARNERSGVRDGDDSCVHSSLKSDWDDIEPAQFFENHAEWNRRQQPERRLMYAVLGDALGTLIACQALTTRRARRLWQETHAWFAADDHEWPFSFVNVCQTLGLDVARVRAWVSRHVAVREASVDAARCATLEPARCTSTTPPTSAASATSCAPTSTPS
jgi:hypothetical protein